MVREFIVCADDSLKYSEQYIEELMMKWGAEELPENHGRLVDADRLIIGLEKLKKQAKTNKLFALKYTEKEMCDFLIELLKNRDCTPTIIEKSEGYDGNTV